MSNIKVSMMVAKRSPIIIITSVLLLQLVTPCRAQQVEPKNHLFKFVGLKTGFDLDRAKQELASILGRISSHNVSLVSMDDNGADWFSRDIDTQEGCPEEDIRQLFSKIKESDGGDFTRDFKMTLTEHFVLDPKHVRIDWLGPCTQIGRKRSEVGDEPAGSGLNSIDESSSIVPATDPPATPMVELSTGLSTEPAAPTTTTDPPTTTRVAATEEPSALDETTGMTLDLNKTVASNESEFGSFFETSDFGIKDLEVNTTTTIQPPTTTTTTRFVQTETEEPLPITTATQEANETASSTTAEPITDSSAIVQNSESRIEDPKINKDSETHYGKYIGLAAAFALSVAYFVYSRAYRRQGMYELQH